jgi:hypothetical protein
VKDDETEIDDAVARYRDEMAAEAALAERDLAEIEDHLRLLIDELRASLPLADAIVAACERMGPPGAVAREHARVRTPFGARLSRARAWSAVAMLAPFHAIASWDVLSRSPYLGTWFHAGFVMEAGLGALVLVALAFRLTWARALVLGTLPIGMLSAVAAIAWTGHPFHAARLAAELAAFGCLMPWRRGELTAPGRGLALMAPAYVGGIMMLMRFSPDRMFEGPSLESLIGPVAFTAVISGAVGALLRARWAGPVTLSASMLLLAGAALIWSDGDSSPALFAFLFGMQLASVVAAAWAATIQWRTAHSTLGTLRSLR